MKPLIGTISLGNPYRNGSSHWFNKRVIPLTASGKWMSRYILTKLDRTLDNCNSAKLEIFILKPF